MKSSCESGTSARPWCCQHCCKAAMPPFRLFGRDTVVSDCLIRIRSLFGPPLPTADTEVSLPVRTNQCFILIFVVRSCVGCFGQMTEAVPLSSFLLAVSCIDKSVFGVTQLGSMTLPGKQLTAVPLKVSSTSTCTPHVVV